MGRAAAVAPAYAEARRNLAKVLLRLDRPAEAAEEASRSITLHPLDRCDPASLAGLAKAYHMQALARQAQGRAAEAIDALRRAVELCPQDSAAHGNLLFTLHYDGRFDAAALLAEHRTWAARHADSLLATIGPHANDRSPDRRLRVGYVSADFRGHSVATFLEPLVEHRDTEQFEAFCYSDVATPNAVTRRFQVHADAWRNVGGQGHDQVAELIRRDRIDVLIDPTGHMADNRLPVFAAKPAPVQIAFPGYPGTCGLRQMDYFLTDAHQDPPGRSEAHYTERLLRLAPSARCYRPPDVPVPVCPLPMLKAGYPTFGSLNRPLKLTPHVLGLWASLLRAAPGARLVLLAAPGQDPGLADFFQQHGVSRGQLDLVHSLPTAAYFRLFGRLDVALDPSPYHGCTTTCDALWMGVPTVTLAGDQYVSRVGVSLLANAGLADELVADSPQAYLAKALALVDDPQRLCRLRAGMRERMKASALADPKPVLAGYESALRLVWRAWCGALAV